MERKSSLCFAAFDDAVLAYYLEHGKPCTAKELSEHSGISIGRVRAIISESKYQCVPTTVDRPVIEPNYRTVKCYRSVHAYAPSREMLAKKIKDLQLRLAQLKGV